MLQQTLLVHLFLFTVGQVKNKLFSLTESNLVHAAWASEFRLSDWSVWTLVSADCWITDNKVWTEWSWSPNDRNMTLLLASLWFQSEFKLSVSLREGLSEEVNWLTDCQQSHTSWRTVSSCRLTDWSVFCFVQQRDFSTCCCTASTYRPTLRPPTTNNWQHWNRTGT